MPLTLVFSFVALFIMITPVLAGDDEASEQEITVNASSVRGFENLVCQLLHYYCTNTPLNVQQLLTKVDNLVSYSYSAPFKSSQPFLINGSSLY